MKDTLIFNPFTRIAGGWALLAGLLIMIITSITGYFSQTVFDGVLDVHLSFGPLTWTAALAYPFLSTVIFIITTALIALCFTRRFRLLDLAGTLFLARAPFLLSALGGFWVKMPQSNEVSDLMTKSMELLGQTGFLATLALIVIATIWNVILSVNAVRVSCNLSGNKLSITMISSIVAAEVIAKTLLTHLLA